VTAMKKLRILIVEDDSENPGALLDRLPSGRFENHTRPNAPTALDLVKEGPRFDVAFVDLQLTNAPKDSAHFEGIRVAESIRKLHPETVIVVYSGHITRGKESAFLDYQACIEAGADAVFSRRQLFSTGADTLAKWIDEWIQKRRDGSSARLHVEFDESLRTQAALEIFPRATLEPLLGDCVQPRKFIRVEALQAGWSGAAIFRVCAADDAGFASPIRLIVKLLRGSRFPLEGELQRQPAPGSLLGSVGASPLPDHIFERDGVYAIQIPEVRDRKLLRKFLTRPGLSPQDKTTLKRLVQELLVKPAQEAQPWKGFNVDREAYRFSATAGCDIVDFLTEAAKWNAVLTDRDSQAISTVEAFVQRMLAGHWNFTVENRHAVRLHGDFHCRNVFVAPNDSPVLIDFGRTDVYPRLFDFAALDADILLSVMHHGSGMEHDFRKIQGWFEESVNTFPFTTTRHDSQLAPTSKATFLRQTLLGEITGKLKAVTAAEYRETLLFQLLRYLRFPSVPLAKKVLAVRLAEALIQDLGLASDSPAGTSPSFTAPSTVRRRGTPRGRSRSAP